MFEKLRDIEQAEDEHREQYPHCPYSTFSRHEHVLFPTCRKPIPGPTWRLCGLKKLHAGKCRP